MIKVLPPHVVHKIAAGEVIERPVSMIKELVENSIDAKATDIRIEIDDGGKERIKIIDNGHGISESDLVLTIHPHATSKISQLEDLESIKSFGFRGEALASIAAISRLQIQSRYLDAEMAFELTTFDGEVNIKPCALTQGTTIEITDIFHNVPVRRKFLKSKRVETDHILKFIMAQVLMFPQIRFQVYSNNKCILSTDNVDSLSDRIHELYGETFFHKLLPISYEGESIMITGYISKPELAVKKSPIQHLLVNNRVIQDRLIAGAVLSGFDGLLMVGMKPEYILSIQLQSHLVDVNIHPRKTEIRFVDEKTIFHHVKMAVQKAIEISNTRPQFKREETKRDYMPSRSFRYTNNGNQSDRWSVANPQSLYSKSSQAKNTLPELFSHSSSLYKVSSPLSKDIAKNWKVLGQIHDSYIVVQNQSGLLLVDQHAAHERINFERLKACYYQDTLKIQTLTVPIQMELSVAQWEIWQEAQSFLQSIGIDSEVFGTRTIAIQAIETSVKKEHIESIISEILSDWAQIEKKKSIEERVEARLATIACRMSIMFGDKLSLLEQEKLIDDLYSLPQEYCPHGRPASIEISLDELEKQFRRKE